MRMTDIIDKKKIGGSLSNEEIHFFVKGYTDGSIPDYQASALLMAILLKGMNKQEIFDLTEAMLHSGDTIDLSMINGIKVDKHSTGGVGDKTSLTLGALVASCGAKFAKMSGRGLGHTGGTLDKLESIPNFSISLTSEEFVHQVQDIGMAIIGQTTALVPADKKMYALRDVTGTVDSIPLIASSIMSKKLASGSDTILLDVKYGEGAFMKTVDDAVLLAETMVEIGKYFGKDTRAEITSMVEPLGLAVGNNLEVKEAVLTLLGKGPKDFTELCLSSGSTILLQAHLAKSEEEARSMLEENIRNGKAYQTFLKFVEYQHGDVSYIENLDKFPVAKNIKKIYAKKSGYISKIDALEIGLSSMRLGGGREKKEDPIDMSAGIVLSHKVGDFVNEGDPLCTLYTNKDEYSQVEADVLNAFEIVKEKVSPLPLIVKHIE